MSNRYSKRGKEPALSSGKKRFVLVLLFFLLATIPVSVYLALRGQETRGSAAPATTLAFDPASTQSSPMGKTVGDTFTLTIKIDTGVNSISGTELHIQYDQTKLTGVDIDIAATPFLPSVLVPGTIQNGFAFITLGSSPTDPKKGQGTLATITFRALASTGGAPTSIRFTTDTRVAGINEATNVLANQPAPAFVTVNPVTSPAPSPTRTPTPTSAPAPTSTPTPTKAGGGTTPTKTPTPTGNIGIGKTNPTATPIVKEPTAPPIPVTADVGPTTILTLSGVALFLFGAALLLLF